MSKGKQTRDNILNVAFKLASENGLESLTIGELAKQCGMSKSGLFAHFNAKENLQAAVVEYANEIFIQRVIVPARADKCTCYKEKITALLNHWLNWNQSFQGSCMFLDAWREKCVNQTPAQQVLKQAIESWLSYLQIQIGKGIENKEFRSDLDPIQATFELYGLYLSAHLYHSMYGQDESTKRFWLGVERLILDWHGSD
ncbi:TetR/AcrR family transcriptional regulator [Pseudoalteromonas rubra]|uniref:TetR/AcrR family transcriptional regulator n=1 Tax=Pseudoalteromonas rubra TaxID=43658 RepID=UPI002DBE6D0B|nr:TetR/AcrR family transcriptional regulator [Pseudoalteromonas rubra]MEC4090113.1 TetR/AcrR family transcriptional regulator [Pseudoalteromonas rubra]